jgi:putative transposase
MMQMARNVAMAGWGVLAPGQYLIHDRDMKFRSAFQATMDMAGVKRIVLPAQSPNLNAYAERWVRSVKEEGLSRLMLFGEASLRHTLHEHADHSHHERNHQGKGNILLFPSSSLYRGREGSIRYRERLGGLLKYYERKTA